MTSWPDMQDITIADFEARRQSAVKLVAEGESMPLEIAEINPMGQSQREGGAFSVVLRGPREPVVDQATHHLVFEDDGPIDLFLVPVGEDALGMLYEAVFT
ncbi:DUF6916 family protein [Oceaniradius stylonematis]|uniref:DUF6916 family protein n=1 Tax=Oceaniradius stylonematis TaxID=2184161 RepID=UPI00273F572E|nr:hypothetical protein [Oceaniradius stylonematis]